MAKLKYACGNCGHVHDLQDEASECCAPEVFEVFQCEICRKSHEESGDADFCCGEPPPEARCPACGRTYSNPHDLNRAAITVAGHCQICNPKFSYEEQHEIEGLHHREAGDWERVNA